MSAIHSVHTERRVPARVLRPSGPAGERRTLCDLTLERFLSVLVHPVPAIEMEKRTGTFRPGGKVFACWPHELTGLYSCLIVSGDQLEVEGQILTIRAVEDYPHCYSEIYVDAP
jgi:hypothetical protein